ncbi:PLP-dependent transferase [Cryphonectria parasitica EP155]|uniref:Molybdenum cofactor sulfurase n=1 Tax=Cryphonectria parasitica (strain ATCC 38755 / EP155) TaxID=660469 RepID=A0A9P4XX27_CRYP1|nr:PLP-dependent transferase [Cryphonectria parasitica EP155]KAF3762481.1 PLP-dependent transferase [Cryphonectria parasitica EP155]
MGLPQGLEGYNAKVGGFRDAEYPMLKDSVYLDHAGTTLYPKSLIDRFSSEMTSSLLGNPHSISPSSQLSTRRIEDTRLRALQFFNANPGEFDLVFVANATAAIKLVAEALRATPGGFDYVYHQASHTSLVGVRAEARESFCLDDVQVEDWLDGGGLFPVEGRPSSTLLFAYPGQSNMDGSRYPLEWSGRARSLEKCPGGGALFTLLDAAALAATSPLDLGDSQTAPDFTVVSFSKIFGFPDMGALIVRRQAEPAFAFRKYFGGGTVETVVCHKEQWHAPKEHRLHERLEDGTLPVHSIIALDVAMRTHQELFGSMRDTASHVSSLTKRLYAGLKGLLHCNGTRVCTIYSTEAAEVRSSTTNPSPGPIIAFNIRNHAGAWISLAEFEKLASLKSFHIRTGGVCNPGGIASALKLQPWEIRRNFSAGFRCGSEGDIIAGKPTGVVRASLGAMSTVADVDRFVAFVDEFYRDRYLSFEIPREDRLVTTKAVHDMYVSDISVYPIKSCAGFLVPRNTDWEVRPEGLAWDREWCLLHQGTGQALSQKRYTNMALIRPVLDFQSGYLIVTYAGRMPDQAQPKEIRVPLSSNPALFRPAPSPSAPHQSLSSRVCGEEILAQTYVPEEINNFFSAVLGVPCVLARFPAGGQEDDKSARHSKAHLQKHQKHYSSSNDTTGTSSYRPMRLSADPPSPPDSDVEDKGRRRILLSNESPILAVSMVSLRALNREIVGRGGREVSAAVFRANIVLDTAALPGDGTGTFKDTEMAYAEDNWSSIRIGQQAFKMLGSCRRCHMVCVNQETGEKGEEPFVTLSKTRRFDGKVFFGTHMCHVQQQEGQNPTVRVGDRVTVE